MVEKKASSWSDIVKNALPNSNSGSTLSGTFQQFDSTRPQFLIKLWNYMFEQSIFGNRDENIILKKKQNHSFHPEEIKLIVLIKFWKSILQPSNVGNRENHSEKRTPLNSIVSSTNRASAPIGAVQPPSKVFRNCLSI